MFEAQVRDLEAVGCEKVYQEQVSSVGARDELAVALDFVRERDTLVLTKLDRLARSTRHLNDIVDRLREKGSYLQVLDLGIDTAMPTGELVLTTLGRHGSPLIRYRTGDLVTAAESPCRCGRLDLALEGGILGRADDMVVVRGVNVYPSAVEEILRSAGGVAEYRVRISRDDALVEMSVEVEPDGEDDNGLPKRLANLFQESLALRVPVKIVEPGTLPRFELKAKRWMVD